MRSFHVLLAALVVTLLATIPASATIVTDDVTFTAYFTSGNYGGGVGPGYTGGATPVSPVTGSFTISFDPTLTYTNDTADITNTVLNGITSASAFAFNYSPSGSSPSDYLVVGGIADGVCCVAIDPSTPVNDFYLQISNFTTSPAFTQFGYTTSSDDYFYTAIGSTGGSVTVTPVVTPEPGTSILWLTGIGLMIVMRRRLARLLQIGSGTQTALSLPTPR